MSAENDKHSQEKDTEVQTNDTNRNVIEDTSVQDVETNETTNKTNSAARNVSRDGLAESVLDEQAHLKASHDPRSIKREPETVSQENDAETKRKLNCNLCPNIFTSMFGLNAHMKTHPEVVCFVLQLLDSETNHREGTDKELSQDDVDSAATSPVVLDPPSQISNDAVEPPKRTRRKKKLETALDDDSDYVPDKVPVKKCRKRGRPPKLRKSSRRSKRRKSQVSAATNDHNLNRKIKTEPAVINQENDKSDDAQGEKSYSCNVCNKKFQSLNGRYLHEKKHTGNYKLKCEKCGKGFNSNHHLEQHLNAHNDVKPFACSKCTKRFASKQKWKIHENKCDPSQPKPTPQYLKAPELNACNFCGKTFLRPDSLKSHIAVQHTEGGKTRFKCEQCGRRFSQKGALKVHQNNPRACLRDILADRAPGIPFVDELLPENEDKDDLAKCLLEEVNNLMQKPHKCEECGTACATADGLEMHRRKHTDNYPFRCKECGKGFNSNVTLEGHLNKHKGTKPHICVKCNKGFYHVSNLQRHFRYCDPEKQEEKTKKKMEEKEHICAFCGKLLQTTGGLLLHMNKHTGQFPFKCTICDKGYNSNMLLKAHVDSHMNVKGFVCQHCGKNFRHKSNLNRHLSYCDPEKQPTDGTGRFSCELCDKTYLRKESLTEHKISKHSSVTFECNVCGKAYDSRGSLFWHRTKSLCAKGIAPGDSSVRRRKIKQEPPAPPPAEMLQSLVHQQHQQQQFQPVPNEVLIEFPTVSQGNMFDVQQQQQINLPIASNTVPIEAAEQASSLPVLETIQTSQEVDSGSKSLVTLVPYPTVEQRTYFNFS